VHFCQACNHHRGGVVAVVVRSPPYGAPPHKTSFITLEAATQISMSTRVIQAPGDGILSPYPDNSDGSNPSASLLSSTCQPQVAAIADSAAANNNNMISFSWSDFPLLGGGQEHTITTDLPNLMEETWSSSSTETASDANSLLSAELEDEVFLPPTPNKPRRVTFSNLLRIRSLPLTLGDHPCCLGGMALTCTWSGHDDEQIEECIDLDVYERFAQRRSVADLRLSYHERRDRLVAATGWTPAELLQREYALVCQPQDQEWHALRVSPSCQGSLHALDV
jgi:hypothetical protein